ncbi:uncharacterized protein EAE98_012126 [Botrytis deweyae]|uniref:Uncharacterized protein n=1 Tax=Botrytis deweyae TaxID=2478750 RepID=A0ABQ7I405_9HELO|nr:uncharacterized protein EAE98_012126 [Botrytis deweyae]KAF7910309.1 hypothetical protein EAE98_012126 [Botrytis deweyae]
MNPESWTPELSSDEPKVYSPATVPPSVKNTLKQKAALWTQSTEPASIDSKNSEADTDTAEQSCNPEIPEAPADTDTVELSCNPEDSYKKLYAEMYKKAYNEAYHTACWDSFHRSYKAGFNAKFTDHYMKAYMRNKKSDALRKLDIDKIPFPNNEESKQTSTQMIQLSTQIIELFKRMQELEKNGKRDMAQRGIIQLFSGLLAMLFMYLVMNMATGKV